MLSHWTASESVESRDSVATGAVTTGFLRKTNSIAMAMVATGSTA